MLFSLADDLDNAGIATYATQRIHESRMWIVILAADKYFYLPASFLLLNSFALGEKKL